MPSLQNLDDFITNNIGTFVQGKWDYIGLAQLYPQLEVLGQLVPRKSPASNYETTVVYQTRNESTGHGAKPGDPVSPTSPKNLLRRKVKLVKYVDELGWVKDQQSLQGKSNERIVDQIQVDLSEFDLHFWEDLEHMMLKKPVNIVPEDDETLFGVYDAWLTDGSLSSGQTFKVKGGADPYGDGRPGSISIDDQPGYTNMYGEFWDVTDTEFFNRIEQWLLNRKLMGAVPNPRLIPDTPSDVVYSQLETVLAVQEYMQAGNDDTGVDGGRYRGAASYKRIPIVLWHALGNEDSPVRSTTATVLCVDWNSFEYSVHPEFDRKIEGPMPMPYVPGGRYITSELWHQLVCHRPDRNAVLTSANPILQPSS